MRLLSRICRSARARLFRVSLWTDLVIRELNQQIRRIQIIVIDVGRTLSENNCRSRSADSPVKAVRYDFPDQTQSLNRAETQVFDHSVDLKNQRSVGLFPLPLDLHPIARLNACRVA